MGIEEERIEIRKKSEINKKRKKVEWLKSRFYKWSLWILVWLGVLMIMILVKHFFLTTELDFKIMMGCWLGMLFNDLLYQLKIIKPYDREKLIIVYRKDK